MDRLVRALIAALVLSGFVAAPVWAADEADGVVSEIETATESDRARNETLDWMPTLAMSFGAYSQAMTGDTSTTSAELPPATGDSLISEFFEFSARLHTPLKIDSIWSKPRLFVTAGVQIPLASGLIAERVDETFDRELPVGVPVPGYLDNCPDTIVGVPTAGDPMPIVETSSCSIALRNRVTIDAMWNVGVGVDLSAEFFETRFHLMPAIEYYGLAVQIEGEFSRTASGAGANDAEEFATTVGDPDILHGIGPSVILGVDVYEEGPFRWMMFLHGRMNFLLNRPTLRASGQTAPGSEAFYTAKLGRTIYQLSGGFQVQYTGLK